MSHFYRVRTYLGVHLPTKWTPKMGATGHLVGATGHLVGATGHLISIIFCIFAA